MEKCKRLLSMVMVVMLCLSLMPTSVLALDLSGVDILESVVAAVEASSDDSLADLWQDSELESEPEPESGPVSEPESTPEESLSEPEESAETDEPAEDVADTTNVSEIEILAPALNAGTASEITQQIVDTYTSIKSKAGLSSFSGYCGKFVNWTLVVLGINKSYVSGNGKDEYNNYCNLTQSSGGYPITAYSASDYTLEQALNAVCANGTRDVYNIVVGFEKGSTSTAGQTYGHTVFIHAILNGTIYYSESFKCGIGGTTHAEGTPITCSISTFSSYYQTGSFSKSQFEGLIQFGSSNSCNCTTDYAGQYTCTASSLYIRSGHGTSYSTLGTIPNGATVTVTKGDGTWAHIEYNGISGYAGMKYLSKISTIPAAPTVAAVKSTYKIEETSSITFNWSASEYATGYDYYLFEYSDEYPHFPSSILKKGSISNTSVTIPTSELGSGNYAFYVHSYNGNGVSGQSNWVRFDVYENYVPSKTVEYNGHTYVRYDYAVSWMFAKKLCEELGGHLVTVADPGENGVVCGLLDESTNIHCWIGLTDYTGENVNDQGTYGWITGEEMTWEFWFDGEPNGSYEGVDKEHFAEVKLASSGYYGWNDLANNSTEITSFILEIEPVEYTVSYDANGGTGAPVSQTKTHNVTLTLSDTTPTRDGYTFLGWSTNSAAISAEYKAGGGYTGNADVTLYAVWEKKTYTVSYDANGGSGAPDAQTKTYGTALTLSGIVPSRMGYTFLGWSTDSTATAEEYKSGSSYVANENVTLYAVWKANTYAVAYDANGGSGAPASQTKTHNVTLMLSDAMPTRDGYTFLGWATNSAATSAEYKAGGGYTGNADVILYAVWEKNAVVDTNAPRIVVSDASAAPGNTVNLTVTVENNPGIASFELTVVYDKEKLNWTGITQGDMEGTWDIAVGESALWVSAENLYEDGVVVLTLTFEVLAGAEGTASVTVAYDDGDIFDENENDVDFEITSGTIRIRSHVAGDVNGDGNVNNKDILRLMKYLKGKDVEVNEAALDINGDGNVNNKDLLRLMKYLKGKDVEIY